MVTERPERLRGRAALKVRTGRFIREWLEKVGEDSIIGIHSAYKKQVWLEVNQFRAKGEQVHVGTYESFAKYFGHLRRLGLVEFVREEPTEWATPGLLSIRDGEARQVVPTMRRIYRLSDLGRSEAADIFWEDPLLRGPLREVMGAALQPPPPG